MINLLIDKCFENSDNQMYIFYVGTILYIRIIIQVPYLLLTVLFFEYKTIIKTDGALLVIYSFLV